MEKKNQTILEWYRGKQKKIDAPCGGNGVCGKCKIRFKTEAPLPTAKEKELLTSVELEENIRLACICNMPEEEKVFEVIGDFWKKESLENTFEEGITEKGKNELVNNLQREQSYGVVIDIGTTTLVMSLVSLLNGDTIATITELNPQRMYGADVVTRIRAANEGNLEILKEILKKALEDMFTCLLEQKDISRLQVKKVVIVGNTTMLHLLCGYSCEGLGRAPFTPVSLNMRKLSAKECEANLASEALIYLLPGISAFIGADIVAGIYACDMDLMDEVGLLVDIGTNGEMVVGGRQGFLVASTAAGPVFEGGSISCGMPAVEGAIIHLMYKDDKWKYKCLGNTLPKGICGSGLIDLLAELYRNQIIDENGTLEDRYFEDGHVIVNNPKIAILQGDIRELQMGKAAIRAGMEILKRKMTPQYMNLAGSFGGGLHQDSAVAIGMFDAGDIRNMKMVGNTALEGAKKFLFDKDGEKRLLGIVAGAKEIVLAKEPEFEELFICNMQFMD